MLPNSTDGEKVGRDSLLPLVPQAHKATNVSGDSPPCQPDLRVKVKPTREMKFFSPLHIVHEPDAAAYAWDEPVSEMDYEELNDTEMLVRKDEIKRRTAAGETLPYALRASGNRCFAV